MAPSRRPLTQLDGPGTQAAAPARVAAVLRHLAAASPTAGSSSSSHAPPKPPVLQQERYLTYAELTEMCQGVASAYPELCELSSIGASREGREVWLLTLTDSATGPADSKPAYFIYGNIHASEPTGAHCAVYNALHLLKSEPELLRRISIYINPRVAVDGAEYCVTTGGRVRSRKWDGAGEHREPNTIYPEDVDGNGAPCARPPFQTHTHAHTHTHTRARARRPFPSACVCVCACVRVCVCARACACACACVSGSFSLCARPLRHRTGTQAGLWTCGSNILTASSSRILWSRGCWFPVRSTPCRRTFSLRHTFKMRVLLCTVRLERVDQSCHCCRRYFD